MFFSQKFYNLDEFSKQIKSEKYLIAKKKIIDDIKLKSFSFMSEMQKKKLNEIYSLKNHFRNRVQSREDR